MPGLNKNKNRHAHFKIENRIFNLFTMLVLAI